MEQLGNIRKGAVVEMNGELLLVVGTEFRNPGNWRAILQMKLKNLRTGKMTEQRVRPQDKVEVAYVDEREMQYVYHDNAAVHLMDTETYDQVELPLEDLGDDVLYLLPEAIVKIKLYNGKPIGVELPQTVQLKVTQTDPAIKGATAQAQYKPAITETGLKVMVPPFVKIGDVIGIDTRSGEYLSRVKE